MAKILSVSSMVTTGHVGNSASVFALQRLGHEVWPITTISLPHHPGHMQIAPAARTLTSPEALDATLLALDNQGWLKEIAAVSVGYMATSDQTRTLARWIRDLIARDPGLLVMVDPIIGDGDALYVESEVAGAARDLLLPLADLAKPNRFELGWLSGKSVRTQVEAIEAAASLGVGEIVVTSAPAKSGRTANLALSGGIVFATETERLDPVPKGTGDLFGALYLAARLDGDPLPDALSRATSGVFAVLSASGVSASRELALVKAQDQLSSPAKTFNATRISMMSGAQSSQKRI